MISSMRDNTPDTVCRYVLAQPHCFGGFKMINLEMYFKGLKLTWIISINLPFRIIFYDIWTKYIQYLLILRTVEQTLEKFEGAIKNGQSRETGKKSLKIPKG